MAAKLPFGDRDIIMHAISLNFRRKAEAVKGRHPESVRRGSREAKAVPTPEFNGQGDVTINVCFITNWNY